MDCMECACVDCSALVGAKGGLKYSERLVIGDSADECMTNFVHCPMVVSTTLDAHIR